MHAGCLHDRDILLSASLILCVYASPKRHVAACNASYCMGLVGQWSHAYGTCLQLADVCADHGGIPLGK